MIDKIWVEVSYPIRVDMEFDKDKVDDKQYIKDKREEARVLAEAFIVTNGSETAITNSNMEEMVECHTTQKPMQ